MVGTAGSLDVAYEGIANGIEASIEFLLFS